MVGHCEGKEFLSLSVLPNPPVPAASQEGGKLHSSPLPSFLLGVRDRDSLQGMGTLLAAQSHQVPQPSVHKSHQSAVVVTSIPHACTVGSRVCSSLTLPIYLCLQLPKLRIHMMEGQVTQILGPMRIW